jgi:predicted transcriptional regulator
MSNAASRLQVDRFILAQIDSVPHLEALLLLFKSRPRTWSIDEMANSLYVHDEVASKILDGLLQRNLIAATRDATEACFYIPENATISRLLEDVDVIYRKEVVRISSLIHSKGSAGLRDFARAFRIRKDKD